MSTATIQSEIDLIVRMRREADADGWHVTASLDDVPEAPGYYGLDDGLRGLGGGVTMNMRAALRQRMDAGKQITRPIYSWKPDTDGSATSWLEE